MLRSDGWEVTILIHIDLFVSGKSTKAQKVEVSDLCIPLLGCSAQHLPFRIRFTTSFSFHGRLE